MENETLNKNSAKKLQKLPIIPAPSKKLSEKEETYLRELGNYEFMNLEQPGLMQKFTYGEAGNKHTFVLLHGGKYTVPRFIARFIDSRSTPLWGRKPDGEGRIQKYLKGKNSRFQMREVFE